MANTTYTVKKGDTLSKIALEQGTTVSKLVELNRISNPDYIVVGQELIISGTAKDSSKNKSSTAKIGVFGLQSNTDRTVYATWTWDKDNTENYEVKWMYATGDGVGFLGSKSTVDEKQSLYTAPSNATHVAFYVKPISKKKTTNNKETSYWTAEWSTVERYYFADNPPTTPSVPTVTIDGYTLTAELDNLDVNGTHIEFQVVRDNTSTFIKGKVDIARTDYIYASYSAVVLPGSQYKVRCRAVRDDMYSDWSDYSGNVGTAPLAPDILELRALTETSIYMDWTKSETAKNYEIEYASKKSRFDSSTETQTMTVESVISHVECTGLESGNEWFFRVRATNDDGKSGWSEIRSVKVGTNPAVPTTWSSTTTVTVGDDLTLYWVHNSEDGSSQTYAELEIKADGKTNTYTIENSTDEDEKDKTSFYVIDTSEYPEGTKIQWRVRTRGILETYSDWSIQRTVDVYATPSLSLVLLDRNDNEIETFQTFPFYIKGVAGPDTQNPIGYHVSIIADETYETTDSIGNIVTVNRGEEIYSKYFDMSSSTLYRKISANDVRLENNTDYTVVCTVSMNSGLTAKASCALRVRWWLEEGFWPNAEIGYDPDNYSAIISPYCTDTAGELINTVTLGVYRREFDGSFTEIASNLKASYTYSRFVTDPHPSLDYARYRIVATDIDTGVVIYYDTPGYPIGEKSIIIQWNEDWIDFDVIDDAVLEKPTWSGSLLKLPYNVDISNSYSPDVDLVEYIGREQPVSYYGTQRGESATWNVVIEKSDKETLYALRRLARWMGDVYVREPSGSGYWANITVSFNQKHNDMTIPVTLSIKRVAGGV
jgi:LysM repeat protein